MSAVNDHPDIEKLPLEVDGIPVRETIREIFRNPENGTPDNISKAGCLALAIKSNEVGRKGKKGYVVWNAWRETFPVEYVLGQKQHRGSADFSGHDFRGASINFSKFKFGDAVNFQGSRFDYGVSFSWSICGKDAQFIGAMFDPLCNFEGARWGRNADFRGVSWGPMTNFRCAQWGPWSKFDCATWGDDASFHGAQWDYGASFRGARWAGKVVFKGQDWGQLRKRYDSESAWLEAQTWATQSGVSPIEFLDLDFSGATFSDVADFSNRQFKSHTNFGLLSDEFKRKTVRHDSNGNTVFNEQQQVTVDLEKNQHRYTTFGKAPIFHGCELHQDTSFEGAQFPKPTGREEAARAYRTLKLAFSKQQAIREEQRFFRLEMEEETLRETSLKRWLFKAYKYTSDYGFSITRPLLVLAILWLMFAQIYGSYKGVEHCFSWAVNCKVQSNWLNYSLQQALPLPGFDKLKHAIEGVSVAWLFIHKTLSLAALFLVGLALRNLFKLK